MRYKIVFDEKTRRWVVLDTFVGNQAVGLHETQRSAAKQAIAEERAWSIHRTPAEDVALMMA